MLKDKPEARCKHRKTRFLSFGPKWLQPLIGLILDGDFSNASALVQYYPTTQDTKLVECAALLGAYELSRSESVLKTIPLETHMVLSNLLKELNLNLAEIARQARAERLFYLSRFLYEILLNDSSDEAHNIVNEFAILTENAFVAGEIEIGGELLKRLLEINLDSEQLLKCAAASLSNLDPKTRRMFSDITTEIVQRALNGGGGSFNIESRLRLLELMTFDPTALQAAFGLAQQILDNQPDAETSILDLFLPLLEDHVHFGEVADFLLAINPGSVEIVVNKLIRSRSGKARNASLDKAKQLLETRDFVGLGFASEFTSAILAISKVQQNLENYAKRLADMELPAHNALSIAAALLHQQSKNHELVAQLTEKAIEQQGSSRTAVEIFLCLSDRAWAQARQEADRKYLRRATALVRNPNELLALATRKDLPDKLIRLLDYKTMLAEFQTTDEGFFEQHARTIIQSALPSERKKALQKLLDQASAIPAATLILWIGYLMNQELRLSDEEYQKLVVRTKTVRSYLQAVIGEKLSEQLSKEDERKFFSSQKNYHAGRAANYNRYGSAYESKGIESQTTEQERHTRISFPLRSNLESKIELRVQLTKLAPPKSGARKKLLVPFPEGATQIALDVQITGPAFAAQEWRKSLKVPVNDDSEEITFTLVPLETGMQVVEIEFYYQASRIGYVIVNTAVQTRSLSSNVRSMEDPTERLRGPASRGVQKERRTLHVSWFEKGGKFSYTVYSSDSTAPGEWEQGGPEIKNDILGHLRELNAFLTEVVTYGDPTDASWNSIRLNLKSVGKGLFDRLIPAQLATQLRRWKSGSILIISTNEQWVPWELMHDGKSFLGKKFILARYPRLSNRRTPPETDRPFIDGVGPLRKIVNVVGGGIGAPEAKRASELFSILLSSWSVTVLQKQPVSVLQEAVKDADALHLTCHGYLDPHVLQIADGTDRVLNLAPETVKELPLRGEALVFANACASSAPVLTFGQFGSFGWEFYRQGTDLFIGTLGAVPTNYAIAFAESVYRELFRSDVKQTIGQALATAKKEAERKRNLFWLLYCIYGDPDFSIQDSATNTETN